jgi:hypothetical protein
MVVFNAVDRIHDSGLISSVNINFSSPPLIRNPMITLYLLSNEGNNPKMFHVVDEEKLSVNYIRTGRKGVRTIALENPIVCHEDQFVALAFGPHSGSPASAENRNEYSVNLVHFCNVKDQNKPIMFNNYPTKGAAFSFVIEQATKGILLLFYQVNSFLLIDQNSRVTVISTQKDGTCSIGMSK